MKKHKMSYFTAFLITLIFSFSLLYVVDAKPFSKYKYSGDEKIQAIFKEQCDELQNLLEPYGISFSSVVTTGDDGHGRYYVAEIPVEDTILLTIDVRCHTYNQYPRCIITMESGEYTDWEDAVLNPSEYPVLFEVLSYYSNGRISADKLHQTAIKLYQETLEQVHTAGPDNTVYNSQTFKGIFVELGDLGYHLYSNDSERYQTDILYYCTAFC